MVHNESHQETHTTFGVASARDGRRQLRPSGGASNEDTGMQMPPMAQMMAMMQQMQQMLQAQQQRIEALDTAHHTNAVDAVPSPIPSYRLPSTAARNGKHNRPSFGMPAMHPFSPSTPPAGRRSDEALDQYDDSGGVAQMQAAAVPEEDDGVPEKDIKLIKDVTSIIKAEPFYGDASKDKSGTIIDFVEKIEQGLCYNCGKAGHLAWECLESTPSERSEGKGPADK